MQMIFVLKSDTGKQVGFEQNKCLALAKEERESVSGRVSVESIGNFAN